MRKWIASAVVSVSLAAAMPVMLTPSAALASASAFRRAHVLLRDMTLEELVDMRNEATRLIFESGEYKEVTVPPGVYRVGPDIPAGHWTIRAYGEDTMAAIYYVEKVDSSGMLPDYNYRYVLRSFASPELCAYEPGTLVESTDIQAAKEWYFIISEGSVVFSPYTGNNFGFN